MKNVTIALDDETHRAARIRAAELGTSLSALVKGYLESLGNEPAPVKGVREMPMTFTHAPPTPSLLPPGAYGLYPDGTPYYTKDGKPRTPGSMKGAVALADDFDEWPPEMLAFFDKLQSEPFDEDSFDPLP
jgi:hypothetical protein